MINNPNAPILAIKSDFEGYSCKFSPFEDNKIACAYSQYYGMIGNGRLSVYQFSVPMQTIQEIARFNTNDGCFDLTWSEANENQIATAQGDGMIKIWDIKIPNQPIANLPCHAGEIFSVAWNITQVQFLLTAGYDSTVKLHDLTKNQTLNTFADHLGPVYNATWHPTIDGLFASCSADSCFKVTDIKSGKIVKTIQAHNAHVMHCDFNKYENCLATAGSDGGIAVWDLRMHATPLISINAHKLSTKKVVFSPFDANVLASVSYDLNAVVWNTKIPEPVKYYRHHTEFVCGVDFSMFDKTLMATCSWDRSLTILKWA